VVKEAIEDGGGDGAITVKDGRPLFEGFVGGDNNRTAFVALADNLEEQVGSAQIDGQVSDLIQNEQCRAEIMLELAFEGALRLGGTQSIDDVDSVSKQDAVSVLASGVAQSLLQDPSLETLQN